MPEWTYAEAGDKLTKLLATENELRSVELQLKSQRKRGKNHRRSLQIFADCDGAWGKLHYGCKDGTVEIILLTAWDTAIRYRFTMGRWSASRA